MARRGRTVVLARTIGVPLRYFVAKMFHGPILLVAERIDTLFDWCRGKGIAWQFEPAYTRMVPAHYLVEIDQVGCPDPAPRYHRFFDPPVALGSADIDEAGAAYVSAAARAVKEWLRRVPEREPVAVAFSGGIDSLSVLLLRRPLDEVTTGLAARRTRAQTTRAQATDEDVAWVRRWTYIHNFSSLDVRLVRKLLARLEAVERERSQIERDLKFCEEELTAGEW